MRGFSAHGDRVTGPDQSTSSPMPQGIVHRTRQPRSHGRHDAQPMYDTKTMTPFPPLPRSRAAAWRSMTPEIPDTESNWSCSAGMRNSELGIEAGRCGCVMSRITEQKVQVAA